MNEGDLIEITINEDIDQYEADVWKGLTARHLKGAFYVLITAAALYILFNKIFLVPVTLTVFMSLFLAVPVALFNFLIIEELPLKEFLQKKWEYAFSEGYGYVSDSYSQIVDYQKATTKQERKKKKKKKDSKPSNNYSKPKKEKKEKGKKKKKQIGKETMAVPLDEIVKEGEEKMSHNVMYGAEFGNQPGLNEQQNNFNNQGNQQIPPVNMQQKNDDLTPEERYEIYQRQLEERQVTVPPTQDTVGAEANNNGFNEFKGTGLDDYLYVDDSDSKQEYSHQQDDKNDMSGIAIQMEINPQPQMNIEPNLNNQNMQSNQEQVQQQGNTNSAFIGHPTGGYPVHNNNHEVPLYTHEQPSETLEQNKQYEPVNVPQNNPNTEVPNKNIEEYYTQDIYNQNNNMNTEKLNPELKNLFNNAAVLKERAEHKPSKQNNVHISGIPTKPITVESEQEEYKSMNNPYAESDNNSEFITEQREHNEGDATQFFPAEVYQPDHTRVILSLTKELVEAKNETIELQKKMIELLMSK